MDAIFGKTLGAVALVVAVVKFAFCVPRDALPPQGLKSKHKP